MLGADTRADIADTLIKKRQSLYYLQIEWTSGAPGYKKRGILNVKHCFASKHLNSLCGIWEEWQGAFPCRTKQMQAAIMKIRPAEVFYIF